MLTCLGLVVGIAGLGTCLLCLCGIGCLLLLFAGGWVTCYLIVLIDLIYLVLGFDGCFC